MLSIKMRRNKESRSWLARAEYFQYHEFDLLVLEVGLSCAALNKMGEYMAFDPACFRNCMINTVNSVTLAFATSMAVTIFVSVVYYGNLPWYVAIAWAATAFPGVVGLATLVCYFRCR